MTVLDVIAPIRERGPILKKLSGQYRGTMYTHAWFTLLRFQVRLSRYHETNTDGSPYVLYLVEFGLLEPDGDGGYEGMNPSVQFHAAPGFVHPLERDPDDGR